jgi:hypothetical protein
VQSAHSRAVKYIIISTIILLVADVTLIIVNLFVDLPRISALLAPLWLTAVSLLLLFIAFLELRK